MERQEEARRASRENRPEGLCHCHTKEGWARMTPTFRE